MSDMTRRRLSAYLESRTPSGFQVDAIGGSNQP